MKPHTVILTPHQRRLRDQLLSVRTGREICRALKLKPSQLANGAKDVYRKLGYFSRLHMLACEIERLTPKTDPNPDGI
jgi:DNA-binding CsgD family transcriptional regulator